MAEEKDLWWCDLLFETFQKFYLTTYGSEIKIISIVIPEGSKPPGGNIDYLIECSSGPFNEADIVRVQIGTQRAAFFQIDTKDLTSNSLVIHFQDLMTNDARLIVLNKSIIDNSAKKADGSFIRFERGRFKYNRRRLEFGAWYPLMGNLIFRGTVKKVGNIAKDIRARSIGRTWFPG